MKMSTLERVAWIFLIAGALNWGFIASSNLNLFESIFGEVFSRFLYFLVGLSGLYWLFKEASAMKK